jgi:opacity protein-like surface antigen
MRKCRAFGAVLIVLFLFTDFLAMKAYAESYVAGQIGVVLPLKATGESEVTGGSFGSGTSSTNPVFKDSVLGGARFGHFFKSIPWFGLSTEVSYSTPNLAQQALNVTPSGSAPNQIVRLSGQSMRTVIWSNNLEFRVPGVQVEPYGGIGLAVMFAHLQDATTGIGRSDTSPGLNVYVGGRYWATEHVTVFAEWKYNHIPLSFDPNGSLVGFSTNFTTMNVVLGAGYHF